MNKQKIYFPNLNGLRFIAAFLVIIHHIELNKEIFSIPNYWHVNSIYLIGRLGVVLFFVLSGFLITFLLLSEERIYNKISVPNFYIRRVLRIWPLYFLIIFLAFLVLPNIDLFILPNHGKSVIYSNLFLKLFLFLIFFPNLVLSQLGIVPYASVTWSIGTEEQFYLIWPLLLKRIKKYRIALMICIVVFYLIVRQFLSSKYSINLPYHNILKTYWSLFTIHCMAIGGLFAIFLHNKHKLLAWVQNSVLFYLTLILTLFLLIKGVNLHGIHIEFYSVLFGIIILNFASNKSIKISLENKVLNYLGNISYGLYMYHPIAIVLALYICKSINVLSNWLIYPLTFVLTFVLAELSFKYFESFFLKFKHRFSNILSGSVKQ